MGTMLLRHNFPSLRRCEKCHKSRRFLYEMRLDEISILVCSGMCAEEARLNWQEKKDKNIKPGSPVITDESPDMLGDNIMGG